MISKSREKLLKYIEDGNYVFHGSGRLLGKLEPRQATNDSQDGSVSIPDGEPAVFASSEIEIPIFMALFNRENSPKGCYGEFHATDGVLEVLKSSKECYEKVKESGKGFVYVFDKKHFKDRENTGIEYVSNETVTPIEIVPVAFSDLKHHVSII